MTRLDVVVAALAAALVIVMLTGHASTGVMVAGGAATLCLAIQVGAVRPAMARRTDAIRAGAEYTGRSRFHLVYVGAECVKVLALLMTLVLVGYRDPVTNQPRGIWAGYSPEEQPCYSPVWADS